MPWPARSSRSGFWPFRSSPPHLRAAGGGRRCSTASAWAESPLRLARSPSLDSAFSSRAFSAMAALYSDSAPALVFGSSESAKQLSQFKVNAGKLRVDCEGFLELQASAGGVALSRLFMGHDLMHLRRFGGYQCQAQHGFAGRGRNRRDKRRRAPQGWPGPPGAWRSPPSWPFPGPGLPCTTQPVPCQFALSALAPSTAANDASRWVRALAVSPGALLCHPQQRLNLGQVRLHIKGRAQMGLRLAIVALKKEQILRG